MSPTLKRDLFQNGKKSQVINRNRLSFLGSSQVDRGSRQLKDVSSHNDTISLSPIFYIYECMMMMHGQLKIYKMVILLAREETIDVHYFFKNYFFWSLSPREDIELIILTELNIYDFNY